MKKYLILLCCLGVMGCEPTPPDASSATVHALKEVNGFFDIRNVQLMLVDNKEPSLNRVFSDTYTLSPGAHTLSLQASWYQGSRDVALIDMKATLEAGKAYDVKADFDKTSVTVWLETEGKKLDATVMKTPLQHVQVIYQ